MSIRKVAVIGAGTMGAGIAGQVANAGIEVWLLDLPSKGENVNALAQRGLDRLLNPDQPGLMSEQAQALIHLGNTQDDFHQLADCDWVAEAVVERLDIKKALYQRLEQTCHQDAIISSNTSTIPIKLLVEEMPLAFRRRFAITHFFNPVRFMRLLELVSGEDTHPEVIQTLNQFCDEKLGKGVVNCADTPGFLGNRVGVYAIQCALHAAFDLGLSPAEADAIFGRPMGIPKTGVFGLYDLIGIDLMADVVQSLVNILPPGDAFHTEAQVIPLMQKMIKNGQTGNKNGQGFYRDGEQPGERFVLDFTDQSYKPLIRTNLPLAEQAQDQGIGKLLDDDGIYGQFAWRVLSRTLTYAASLIPEVGKNPLSIDDAMKLGYNWIYGPFEMIDQIGVDHFIEQLKLHQIEIPEFLAQAAGSSFYRVADNQLQTRIHNNQWETIKRASGVIRFTEQRRLLSPVNSNEKASWYQINEMAMVEFHSKANALDDQSMAILADAINQVPQRGLTGLIVHNDAQHFSCGVNLMAIRDYFEKDDLDGLDGFLNDFQQTVLSLAQADFPVIAAPSGLSIGGGFEVVLHAKQVHCHANSVMGLVESLVGVVPAGGGCKETLYRWVDKLNCADDVSRAAWKAFMNLGYAKTATSPIQAMDLAMLRPNDSYEMNRDRLLNAAQEKLASNLGQLCFERPPLAMPGRPVFHEMIDWLNKAFEKAYLTPHDVVVGTEIARIVTGGDIEPGSLLSQQDLYNAERQAFLSLVSTDATKERICSMLDTGKPLRN